MLSIGEKIFIKKTEKILEEDSRLNTIYSELYDEFKDDELKNVLSSYHYLLSEIFRNINKRLLGNSKYIHAETSRNIIKYIMEIENFMGNMAKNKIILIEEYEKVIEKIKSFIRPSWGTVIPDDFLKIQIKEAEPIFILRDSIVKENSKETFKLMPIGRGSYAQVYSYYDKFYDEKFVLKRLKEATSKKDYDRFYREFKIMKDLNSIFIAKVYRFNEEKKEYLMEYLDTTLYNYIEKKNVTITLNDRMHIIQQLIRVFKYLNKKNILHRDISPTNILLKFYDDTFCIKLSDFGLVKIEDSILTDPNSEFRGSLNDPRLRDIGFEKYDSSYEMYALTRLIAFILTGKSNLSKIKDENILEFLKRGISDKIEERYQNIFELEENFKILYKKIKVNEG